jgi:hypothetical protein
MLCPMQRRDSCECGIGLDPPCPEPILHAEAQDTSSDAWKRLLDLVEDTAAKQGEVLDPWRSLGFDDAYSFATLPASIAKLGTVRRLSLYGSSIVRLPAEVWRMTALEEIDTYTAYRLHWYPYEIGRCRYLRASRVSTRALYGNRKHRPAFPDLRSEANRPGLELARPAKCSVCNGPFGGPPKPRWISLRIATDVLPLLAYACSDPCLASLPPAAPGHVPQPHQGGRTLVQLPGG